MTKKRKLVIAVGVLLAVALVAGLTGLATGVYGSQSDPLVTLSYLNQSVMPAVMTELDTMIDQKASEMTADFDAKLDAFKAQVSLPAPGTDDDSQSFSVVSLTNGQTLVCSVGTEIMLRIGTAVSAGPDVPRLIDETTGSSVNSAGTALVKNHMYMVTINGNGIKATSNVKVLIRGSYTIG